jgi:hypothetical protein
MPQGTIERDIGMGNRDGRHHHGGDPLFLRGEGKRVRGSFRNCDGTHQGKEVS